MSLAEPTPESERNDAAEPSHPEPPDDSASELTGTIDEVVETGAHGAVIAGRLSYENRIADVLRRLAKTKPKSDAILQLRSPNGTVDGSILITNRRLIAGAACDRGQLTGYAAVRKLLMLTAGDYRWTVLKPSVTAPIERNLNINMKALIPKLPFLPEQLSEFFDESSLLDRIFHPKKWAEFADDSSILDWVFSPQVLASVQPEDEIRKSMPTISRSWTAIEPVSLVNADRVQPIKVPRHLREGILRGESLAHTVTRNFGTVGSVAYANTRRLQRKKTNFNASRAAGPFLPLPVLLLLLAVIIFGSTFWMKLGHPPALATRKKPAVRTERAFPHHQKAH